ncbi:MAG: type II 3-dehydroquinate dehydratase [Bacteroidales bacterium]
MQFLIINGPNLNLTGTREPGQYGTTPFDTWLEQLRNEFQEHRIDYYQSNVEGELINRLHTAAGKYDGIIMNPGGYSHTSVALADAIKAIDTPVVEVHITNVHSREPFRHTLLTGAVSKGIISGFGLDGYRLALLSFL